MQVGEGDVRVYWPSLGHPSPLEGVKMAETGSERYESVVTVAHSQHVVITQVVPGHRGAGGGDTGLGTSVGVWRVLERRQERGAHQRHILHQFLWTLGGGVPSSSYQLPHRTGDTSPRWSCSW